MVRSRVGYVGAVLLWLVAAGALLAAAIVAQDVKFEVLRQRADIMVTVVAVLVLLAAVPVGPAASRGSLATVVRAAVGCVIALDAWGTAQVLRVVPPITMAGEPRTGDATTVLTVWVVLLGLVLVAAVRVTGRNTSVPVTAVGIAAACGFVAAAVWLGLTALVPWVASSNVPAFLMMIATGAVAAHLIERRTRSTPDTGRTADADHAAGPDDASAAPAGAGQAGGLVGAAVAAMVTAVVVAAAIDGLLPLGHAWVRNSAPPWEVGSRLVDPVGLLVLAALLAVVVGVSAGRRRVATSPVS